MATVWAAQVGAWLDQAYETGWSHTITFRSLGDLNTKMEQRKLQGKVSKLGIVAHGDKPGQVVLDRVMTASNLKSFDTELERIRWFLKRDAQVTFYSCIAGKADEGSRFLMALSKMLPGRTIVAFTLYGETDGALGIPGDPGKVRQRESSLVAAPPNAPLLTPEHPATKWAKDGSLIRNAPLERGAQNRCAKPRCPGHSSPLHRCP